MGDGVEWKTAEQEEAYVLRILRGTLSTFKDALDEVTSKITHKIGQVYFSWNNTDDCINLGTSARGIFVRISVQTGDMGYAKKIIIAMLLTKEPECTQVREALSEPIKGIPVEFREWTTAVSEKPADPWHRMRNQYFADERVRKPLEEIVQEIQPYIPGMELVCNVSYRCAEFKAKDGTVLARIFANGKKEIPNRIIATVPVSEFSGRIEAMIAGAFHSTMNFEFRSAEEFDP